jgi:cyclic-di-GMP-binding biofilm dispersal mediator protein
MFGPALSGLAEEADMPVLGMSAYCASKAAARAAVQVAGREWRRSGRRVLDVRAPHTDTGLAQRALWGHRQRCRRVWPPRW